MDTSPDAPAAVVHPPTDASQETIPMETSQCNPPVLPTNQNAPSAEDLDAAMASIPDGPVPLKPSEAAPKSDFSIIPGPPKQGKKNARFGRNPDGTPAKKADKKEVERKSEWGRFLHNFKLQHPQLHSLEATIEARKVYVPQSGKQKSFERIFTEVWKVNNPHWQKMSKEQRTSAIREAFIKKI
jgi:hypothetical protein